MRILLYIHAFPPVHNAGAETMIHEMAQQMRKKGHEVRCIAKGVRQSEYNGIPLLSMPAIGVALTSQEVRIRTERERWLDWADVIWTHLGQAGDAVNQARFSQARTQREKPVLHLVHNDAPINVLRRGAVRQGLIFNSNRLRDLHLTFTDLYDNPHPYTVCRPTINADDYLVESTGDAVTLINVNENKGGWIFYQVAERMPRQRFIGVQGMYGHQVFRDNLVMTKYGGGEGGVFFDNDPLCEYSPKVVKNLIFWENTPDMKPVYRETKILVIMSAYESWGRTASEAMCNGIPVIYSPTYGLKEHVAHGGYMVANRNDVDGWIEAIKEVKKNYNEWSEKAKARFAELGNDYDKLERLCRTMVNFNARTRTEEI